MSPAERKHKALLLLRAAVRNESRSAGSPASCGSMSEAVKMALHLADGAFYTDGVPGVPFDEDGRPTPS